MAVFHHSTTLATAIQRCMRYCKQYCKWYILYVSTSCTVDTVCQDMLVHCRHTMDCCIYMLTCLMYLPDLLTCLPTHHDLSSTAHAHIHRCICSCLHTSLRIYVHAEYDLAWFSGSLASSHSISGPGGTRAASGSEQWRPSNYGGGLADMSLSLREF